MRSKRFTLTIDGASDMWQINHPTHYYQLGRQKVSYYEAHDLRASNHKAENCDQFANEQSGSRKQMKM